MLNVYVCEMTGNHYGCNMCPWLLTQAKQSIVKETNTVATFLHIALVYPQCVEDALALSRRKDVSPILHFLLT